MPDTIQITPRLWQLKMGNVNAYLLPATDGLVLVDAGWPRKAGTLLELVRKTGHNPTDIRHLVLTHGHIDHAGSAAEIQRRTGARIYAHAADLDLLRKGEAEHAGTTVTPGIIPALLNLIFIKPGGTTYEPLSVDQTLADGEMLPMAKDVQVIHTPGHSAGHIALLLQPDGVLIAGDICSNIMGLGYSILNEDRVLARQSILRAAEYPFEKAVFGHGNALTERANLLLKEKFSNAVVK